ncbi:alpha/beta fold hydrolase [Shimazuella sp. AN120528]|uniref:alpha/beta fold hydrolase n=1 Tax=Shimazuella soli TaxID=1892854 RepID=UPI001F0FA7A7|nr:alpha/beta fold hydrolase [Shimazuella soli]MCH5583446.1 alpha/beta fold hydrolase [Shimazuella soli]
MDYKIFPLGDVTLQSGEVLPNAFLAYQTYGTLNADKSNAIVYPTAFGDQHYQNEWLIGPGMALDPEKYFIIVPNLFGNGLSSSPSNTPAPYDRGRFPKVTIFDNVSFQHRLITEQFGIEKIALVTGWSLGAIQTFQWAASYPDMVERIAPFCGTAKTWPHTYVFLEGVKAPLISSTEWANGEYETQPIVSMRAIGRVYAGWGFSQAFYREQSYQPLGHDSLEQFLSGFWENNFLGIDANNLLSMLWTGQYADISANYLYKGDFKKALQSIRAKAVVMPGTTDLYFTPEDSKYETEQIPNATFQPIDSIWGHFAGRGIHNEDTKFINNQLQNLLALS